MSNIGFVHQLLDNTNWFYRTVLQQFEWYKKIQGTECIVTRIKESSSYKTVFGSIASSTLPDDSESDKFNYVILISMNDMKKLYQKTSDQLQFYDNKDTLKLGDILSFSRKDQEYKWKIVDVQTFSETADVLQMYTISGLVETNMIK